MKAIKIYTRVVLEKTGYRKHPYKEVRQVSIMFDGKEFKNHEQNIDNPKLRVPFVEVLNTRNKRAIEDYLKKLGRSEAEKFVKETIGKIINE